MNFAIIGCGYVAEQYVATLSRHPELRLSGVFDTDASRASHYAARLGVQSYPSREALLADADVPLVVNLTNPRSHFAINRACLDAGKHVYSEKPLAMTTAEAASLAALAGARRLHLASAPCSVLSEGAQTLWKAVRSGLAGRVRLVYATFDDGMIAPHLAPWAWTNAAGTPWPARDEFEVGCTYQHAGYLVTLLCAMFGPARRVTSFAAVQVPDKGIAVDTMAPDFTVGCVEFDAGVVARITCSLVAPRDKSIVVVGDMGTLSIGNVRDDLAPVFWRPATESRTVSLMRRRLPVMYRWLQSRLADAGVAALCATRVPPVRNTNGAWAAAGKRVDFLRGPSELAAAIQSGRRSRLPSDFGVHLVEIVERLQHPERFADTALTTSFAPVEPMPWAV
jgi:predicted dehydrogenase